MRVFKHVGAQDAQQLECARWLMLSALAMMVVVHLLDGVMLSYPMAWAYLLAFVAVWLVAKVRSWPESLALHRGATLAWCVALLVGVYPPVPAGVS